MTRRYLNPAWKNRSTEELEAALAAAEAVKDENLTAERLAEKLRFEITFRRTDLREAS